jgi:hypothetical protein
MYSLLILQNHEFNHMFRGLLGERMVLYSSLPKTLFLVTGWPSSHPVVMCKLCDVTPNLLLYKVGDKRASKEDNLCCVEK